MEDPTLIIGEDLVQSPEHKAAGTQSIDFDGLLSPPLELHEDLSKGCGGQLWPAGLVVAKYMLRHLELLQGRSVYVFIVQALMRRTKAYNDRIELGAGGGLVGCDTQLAHVSCMRIV